MAFKKPENLADLSIEDLNKLNDEAIAEGQAIVAKGEDLTDAEIEQAEALMKASNEIEAEIDKREAAETERADRIAALRDGFSDEPAEEPKAEEEAEEEEDGDEGEEPQANAAAAEEEKEPEAVVASAGSVIRRAKRRAPKQEAPAEEQEPYAPKFAIIASANVPGLAADAPLADMLATAEAFNARSRGFVAGKSGRGDKPQVTQREVHAGPDAMRLINEYTLSDRHQRYGVARIEREELPHVITERMSAQDQYDLIMEAAKASRLGKALTAAGGWCAPSEQVYGFLNLETVSGILDLPSVEARRGGISFTKGPDYGTLAATWGFLQTEAQAEAGTAKTCFELDCPDWDEVRLDAVGFCVTAPVLTNAAYPELTNRVLQIGATAHAHKVNASVISRISTYLGTAINWAEVGGTVSDILDAAAFTALRLRYQYSMAPTAVIEAVFPLWLKEVFRADLSRRLNQDNPLNVPDAAIDAFFRVRGIRTQFVYDYQPLASGTTGTWTAFPTTVDFMMYPAGAFTKLTKNVIDLDTIYDSVGLGTNVYTAAFFEEGLAVANTGASGVKVTVALNTRGAMGYPAVGAGVGVTYPAP